MPTCRRTAVLLVLLVAAALVSGPPVAAAVVTVWRGEPGGVTVWRGGPVVTVPFVVNAPGSAVLDLTADAPGVAWHAEGRESAVVSIDVDGRYASDLVVFGSGRIPRQVALGELPAGRHALRFRFATDRSAPGARSARLTGLAVSVAPDLVRRHAPVLYGRALVSPTENARTDTPLLAWHETSTDPETGRRRITYSVLWSNEDGGTVGPALMARWGRTTDIEWAYSVVVDTAGNRVPGTAVYQGPGHRTLTFGGRFEGDHPRLQTCTANNNLCDSVDSPMRFALAVDDTRPPRRAREYIMDSHPWTYRVMAEEMLREQAVEIPADPATPALGDQRSYVYAEVDKDTGPAAGLGTAPGVALVVYLRGGAFRSDHGEPSWSLTRDDPAATTVELPPGTEPEDIERIDAVRVPTGTADNGAVVTVTDLNRVFLLDRRWRPGPSFASAHGLAVRLTPEVPARTVWAAAT